MKRKFTYFYLLLAFVFINSISYAQSVGDFQSAGSGNWNTIATWETYDGAVWNAAVAAPTSTAQTITIRNTHTVTVAAAAGGDQIVVESGGILTVNNTLSVDNGTGVDLTVNGTLTLLGTITGAGTMTVNGTMDWTGGAISLASTLSSSSTCNILGANKTLTSTLTINNGSIVNWSASQVNFNNGTLLNNGSIIATGDNAFNVTGGTNLFTNSGTGSITKNTGVGQTNIGVPFTNNGSINVNTGTFRKPTNNMTNTGTINLAGGALFSVAFVAVTFDAGSSITGSGIFQIFGSSSINLALTIPSTLTFRLGSNTLSGSGSLSVDGTFDWFGGTLAVPTTINSGGFIITSLGSGAKGLTSNLVVDGTFNWTLGDITLTGATITINNSFIADLAASQFIGGTGSTLIISNGAKLSKTNTSGTTLTCTIGITNNGTISGIGTINFTGANGVIAHTGSINPGNSPGLLTITPTTIAGTAATIRAEILDNTGSGTGNDQLTVNGAIDLTGITIAVTELDPFAPLGIYTIFNSTGALTGIPTYNFPTNYILVVAPPANTIQVEKIALFPLPAVWGDFNAVSKNNNQVKLSWTTLQESNVSSFTIEYSTNGVDFSPIGTVAANGTTTDVSEYTFFHFNPNIQKTNFYRIKQIDFDNKSALSVIRNVKFNKGSVVQVSVYPNPVKDILQVSVQSDNIRLQMTDMSGRILKDQVLQAGNHEWVLRGFSPGIYMLSVLQNNQRIETIKIIKQ